jgi:hypothetical protein
VNKSFLSLLHFLLHFRTEESRFATFLSCPEKLISLAHLRKMVHFQVVEVLYRSDASVGVARGALQPPTCSPGETVLVSQGEQGTYYFMENFYRSGSTIRNHPSRWVLLSLIRVSHLCFAVVLLYLEGTKSCSVLRYNTSVETLTPGTRYIFFTNTSGFEPGAPELCAEDSYDVLEKLEEIKPLIPESRRLSVEIPRGDLPGSRPLRPKNSTKQSKCIVM